MSQKWVKAMQFYIESLKVEIAKRHGHSAAALSLLMSLWLRVQVVLEL